MSLDSERLESLLLGMESLLKSSDERFLEIDARPTVNRFLKVLPAGFAERNFTLSKCINWSTFIPVRLKTTRKTWCRLSTA